MLITGSRITLTPFDRRHLERTRVWANDLELARFLDRAFPICDAEHERWFQQLFDRKDSVLFAVESNEDHRHLGNVWLWNIDWRHRKAEVRIVLGEVDCLGRGLGSESLTLLSGYAFERLNLHKLYAYVLAINPRGVRAFEKVGFQIEGVLRADRWVGSCYTDVFLLGKIAA